MTKICLHLLVNGRVQGVSFRRFAKEHAESNNVTGWVRNLEDGRVEALLCGEDIAVRHVEAWLSCGPKLAKVTDMNVEFREYEDCYQSFDLLPDAETPCLQLQE